MRRKKKQREDIFSHFEGDTDVEEIDEEEDEEEDEEDVCAQTEMAEPEYFAEKKKVVRQGPTSRSHYASYDAQIDDFLPSNDEDIESDDFCDSADDFLEKKSELASGKKRRLKKLKKRVWYDPSRANPCEQFALKLCFTDVYEFRVALRNFHIAQLRNYAFHRNAPSRIIVTCTDEGKAQDCPFF